MHSPERPRLLSALLEKSGYSAFTHILDYGGGSGYLVATLNAPQKAVFDLSGTEPLPGMAVHSDPHRFRPPLST